MQRKEPLENKGVVAWLLIPQKHFDTSGKSGADFHHRAKIASGGDPAKRP
jgi:hypothetical protein